MFGLKQITIDKINSIFKKYSNIKKVLIYGSRAKGNYKKGSDIDLCIFSDEMEQTELFKVKFEIDELMLPYKMDLCIYRQIQNNELKDHINRIGKNFYSKN